MGDLTDIILAVHAAATLLMTGLIWFVQVVHYPLFATVGPPTFVKYEKLHMQRTAWIVGPLMLVEAATAAYLAVALPRFQMLAILGLAALIAIWLSTALVQVPQHRRLAGGFNPQVVRRLVSANWLRTALWSARAVIALALLSSAAAR